MANAPMTSLAASLGASGANVLLRYLASQVIAAGRNIGTPLKYINDVSEAVAQKGEKVGVFKQPDVASALLTDGNAKVLDDTPGTTVDVTLNKHRYQAMSMTQIAQALAGSEYAAQNVRARITGLLNDVESDVLSVITAGITTNTTGTYNTAIDEAAVKGAVAKLDESKTPYPRIGLVRHDLNAYGALSSLAGFDQFQYTGQQSPNVSPMGGQGRLWRDVNWFKTQALPKATNNIDNVVFNPQAIAMAMRPLAAPMAPGVMAETVFDPESGVVFQILYQWDGSKLAEEIVIHCLYGYSVIKETWAVLLKS